MSSSSSVSVISGIVAPATGSTSGTAGTAGSLPVAPAGSQTQFYRGSGGFASAATIGSGSPNTVVTGQPGDIYYDSVGLATYIKTTGANTNTGWSLQSGSVVSVQVLTTSGTYTPTAGTQYAIVEMVGGGGGGAGTLATATPGMGVAGGSGSGGYAKFLLTAAQIGASRPYTIGAAGTGAAAAGAGGNGGTTQFGTAGAVASATGGLGAFAPTQNTTTGTATIAGGLSGGTATVTIGTTILNISGQSGGNTTSFLATTDAACWENVGYGGSNPLGLGGGSDFNTTNTSNQFAGRGYGSGVSGKANGRVSGGNGSTTGLAGQPGVIIITEFR